MTDAERNERIDAILDDVVMSMVAQGLVSDDAAAWRVLIGKGLFNLPDCLCPHHLREDLQRYQKWIGHDLERITPN